MMSPSWFRRPVAVLFAVGFAFGGLAGARAAEINVFAAASLSDALTEIGRAYEAASGTTIRFNFGASSMLALQIKRGAPADVFFSADEARMDDLLAAGLLAPETRVRLLSNRLVVVVNAEHAAKVAEPDDLAEPEIRRLALAEPDSVPAGVYAKEWLTQIGLWKKIQRRVARTANVRACLATVEAGNADAGIVYKTDAATSKKVKIAFEVTGPLAPMISYPVGALRQSKHPEDARAFISYLAGSAAHAVFVKYGFLPVR